jgi:hypothetical protein
MKLLQTNFAVYFIAFSCSLISCKKDPIQYTFAGTVMESVDGNPLMSVNVGVSQRVYEGNVASSFFNSAGLATSGSDGSWEMTFDREKVFEFKVSMTKSGYFDSEQIISSGDVAVDETKIINETLEPKSWIKFHLVNMSGMSTDLFTMIHYNFRTGCTGCTTNDYYYYEGSVDTTFSILTTGGVYTKYSYKNPGAATYIQDSVYTTPFDTVAVNINY